MRFPYILFDWGDTLMRDDPRMDGPMAGWPAVEAVDGAEEVLRVLHARRTVVLATSADQSGEEDIRRALRRVSLDGHIDRIFCFKNTGLRKPSAEFYRHILASLNIPAADALMVGNDFENDALAANRVGIAAVWLNERDATDRTGELYRTIHSLRELPALLD